MPGFYDINGNQPQNQSTSKKKKGFYSIDNKDTQNTLEYDGIKFGTVTNKGLQAIQNNTLDSYTPENKDEARVISSYLAYKSRQETEAEEKKSKERTSALLGASDKIAEKYPINTAKVPSSTEETKAETKDEKYTDRNYLAKPIVDRGLPDFSQKHNTAFGDVEINSSHINPTLSGEQAGVWLYNNALKRYDIKEEKFDINALDNWAKKNNFEPITNDKGLVTSYKPTDNTSEQAKKDYQMLWNLATTNSKRKYEENADKTVFQMGAFKDGYDFGDATKATLSTVADAGVGVGKGVFRLAEGLVDLGAYGVYSVSKAVGADKFAESVKKEAQADSTSLMFGGADKFLDKNSLLGDYADAVAEGLGYVGGIMLTGGLGAGAGLGTLGQTILTSSVTGLSSMGGGMGEAYQGNATDGQAVAYGAMKGVIDAGTELLFGGLGKSVKALGISKGIGGLDDIFAKKLSNKIVSKIANENVQRLLGNTLEYTIKAGGEGFEELLAGLGTAVAKDLTYKSKEELSQLIKDEKLLEQFVIGSVISFISQSPDFVKSIKNNTDFVSGFTKEVELEINEAYETLISEAESNGQKLSKKDKAKIYDKVVENAQGIIIASALAKAMSAETENSVSVDTNTPSVNTVKTNTETTPTVVDPSTLNQGKVDTTSVATSDSIPVTTPTVTETQPTPTVESVQTMPETAEDTPTTKGATSAYTNNNEKIDLKYKVVSLDDLIVSNNADGTVNPNYPQILQPRERTRQASILQVQNIANNLVPEKLGESTNVSDGSPIVGSDNVVESGNGRTMALSLVYKSNPEGAKKYIEFIKANADKFGIDATNLPKNPVLVRERITDVDRVEFVKQANESNLSAMSATELAKSDAERLTSDILNLLVANDDGNINTAENRAFVGRVISNVFSQNDLNSVVGANGMLSANGLERIRNALFYKAYNDVTLASKLSESLDNDIKNITNVLVNIAPKIVQIKNGIANGDLYDLDFSQDIVAGINYLQEAKRQNLKVKDFANQLTMGDDVSSTVKGIAYLFEQKNRGAKQATLFFNHLCDTILSKDANQLGFLNEDTKAPTKEEVLNEAIHRYNNDEQGTGINFSEMFVSQRSEESRQNVDGRGIGDNIEGVAEQRPADSESDGTSEQHRPVEEETAVTGDVDTSRQSEGGTEERRPTNRTDETEVGAGELSYDDFTLDKIKHPKTQADIWVIRPTERIDNFAELREKMKSLGGYYSRFAETPYGKGGFVFKTDPSHLFGNAQNTSNSIETTTNQTQKTNKEEANNGRGKEIPDTGNAESTGGVGEEDSRGEGSVRQSVKGKIEEILRKSSADRNNDEIGRSRTRRVEQKETAEAFEKRVSNDGYERISLGEKTIAFKKSPESEWNKNAREATKTLEALGLTVIVFDGEYRSNIDGVSLSSSQGATIGRGDLLTIFISSDLDIDGMETAYHEAFHSLLRNGDKNEERHQKMVDIISGSVDVESEAFGKFVSNIIEHYSYEVKNVSFDDLSKEITEEFYAFYIGSIYANKNEHGVNMLSLIEQFSDADNIKAQLDAVYAEIKSEATEETPTQNAQNMPKSSDNVSGEEIPAESKKAATEQNTGEIEAKENVNNAQRPKVLDGESGNDDGGLQPESQNADGREGTEGVSGDSGQTSGEVLPSDTVNRRRNESDVGNDSEGTSRTVDNGSSGQERGRTDGGGSGLRTTERTGLGTDGRVSGLDTEFVDETPDVIDTVDKVVKTDRPSNKENFVITNDVAEELDNNLPSAEDNIEAIELLLKIESEGRPATADEKKILAKYKGWGGIDIRRLDWELSRRLNELYDYDQRRSMQDSGLNAFFTPTKVIDAMYNGLKVMGFKGGNVLETSMGIGNFFGRMPRAIMSKSALTGIELEAYTARIAQLLYPGATVINKPFQDVVIKNGSYDLVIGNVPFGNEKISYNGKKYSLHNYFIISSLDKVKDGGIVAVITSAGTLDNYSVDARSAIMDRADVVACYKLPAGVFSRNAKTDVQSDLLILRKRASGDKAVGDSILNVTEKDGMRLNEYFVKHPENILGTLAKGTNAWGEITTVLNSGNFDEMLTDAMSKLPKNIMSGEVTLKPVETIVTTESKPRFFEKDGKVYEDNGAGEAVAITDSTKAETARDYIAVREAYKTMLDAYAQDLPETEIKPLREALNKAYDNFFAKHTAISGDGKKKIGKGKSKNNTFLEADSDYYLLCGLERYDKKAGKFEKSALFESDTLRKKKVTSVDTSSDALAISLNETGGINFKMMSELTGKTEKELADELKGEIVYTPQGTYELIDIYLSGDIYAKLEAVKGKPEFKEQEEMLKKVLPVPKDASQITVKLGANFIDAGYIEDFADEIFDEGITVKKNSTGNWVIEGAERSRWGALVNSKYGCDSLNAIQLLQRILNDADIVCNKTIQQGDKKISVFDKEMTDIALGKAQDIRDAFEQWIFKDARRRNDIVDKYNRMYNAVRPLDYEHIASKLTFEGMSPSLRGRLYPHQRKGIARFLFGGNTLFAHGVGTGKTFEMIASVMEAKRMGIVNKTAMVVPNNKVTDFKKDILEAYPTAKVLVIDTANKKRQTMLGLVNSNDWDIILVARTTFTKIPVSAEMQKNFFNSQIEALDREIAEAQSDRNISKRQINGLITQRKNLEEKLKDLDKETDRDEGVDFDKLGIDCICVDEAHNYKSVTTPSKLQIKGLVNKNDAQQANDMLMKLDYLRSVDGKIIFGTGTPITNTVSEIYNMIRMVRPDILENAGIHSLDEWVNTFAKVDSNFEMDIDGTIKTKPTKSIRSFINSKEMVAMFRQFADIVFTQDVVKDLPKAIHHNIEIEGKKEHKLIKEAVNAVLSSAKGTEKLGAYGTVSGMLNAAAVDLRMLSGVEKDGNPLQDYSQEELDYADSKVNTMVGYIIKHYKESQKIKGTQIVFCDGGAGSGKTYTFNVHKDIKQKLIEQGIPESEIVIVKDQKDAKLEELFEQVNNGTVRVLIGTSAKMAEGLNVQERVVAIHHPTVSYKPSDLEQSDARGVRKGNINSEVHIYRYLQGDTFDSHKWQAIDRKGEMINNALKGEDVGELEDIGADEDGGADIDPATAMAITSGNPLIKAKIDIDKKVASLMNVKKNYQSNLYHYQDILAKYPTEISSYKTLITKIQNDIALRDKYGDKTHIVIKGKTYDKQGEANKALVEAVRTTAKNGTYIKIGEYNGFDIMFKGETGGIDYSLKLKGTSEYLVEYNANGNTMARFAGVLNRLDKDVERYEALVEQKSKDLETARQEVSKPFEREKELEEALTEQKQITYDYEHYGEVKDKYETTNNDDSNDTDSYDQASANDRWKTDNAEQTRKKDVSLNSIVKKIRTKFGIPISTGKVSRKDARGVYKRKAEVIRTRITNNLPTIAHELGHHLDKKYSLSKNKSVANLIQALPQDFLSLYPTKEQGKEAVAEFVRTYLKSKTEAQKLSAEFYNYFVTTLSEKDLRAVNEIAGDFNYYLSMEIDKKYQSAVVSTKRSLKDKIEDVRAGGIDVVKDDIVSKANDTYTDWVDSFNPIKQAVDFVEKSTGKTLDGTDNAYTLATNSLNATTIASYLVNDGFRDLDGNILDEKSFKECIAGVKAKYLDTLSEYLVLKHSLELIEQDMRVFADDTLEDVDTINETIERIEREHPEMIEASENLYQYQRNMLRYYLVDSGLLSEEGFNAMVEKYPCYVPFYRDVSKKHVGARGTFANQSTPIKRIKGSGASILNPLESIVRNTEKFVKASTRNQVMQILTRYANEADGFGQFLEKVPPDMLPHMIDVSRQKEKFTERLQQTVNAVDYFNVTNLLDEVLDDMVMDFTPKASASKKLVTVMENGHASYYQVHDEALYKAIAEMSIPQLKGILNTVSNIMLPMKMLMTQINPLFASSNFLRDYATAYKHSQINNPIEFAVRYASALKAIVSNNETYQQYKAMGGGHSSKLATDIDQIQRMLHDLASKDMGKARRLAYSLFRHPLETITSINNIVESIPRVLEFTRTLEQTGDLQEAIFSADDITTNFKRHGSGATAKFVNSMVFFNNASLQGLDKTRRSITGENARAKLTKWVLFALLSSALQYFWNRFNDEEGYELLSSYTKNNFYNYSIGDGKFIAIPKPREVALLDSFTERTIEYVFGNKDAYYDFGGYLAQNLLPPMLPEPTLDVIDAAHDVLGNTVLGGIADVGFNEDFLGRPIESNYEQDYLESWERHDASTSKLAYRLGQTEWARKTDMSPKKIDHLMSSYLGIIGSAIQAVFPMDETRKDVTLGLRNRFIKDSVYSTDVMNILWDNVEKAEQQYKYNPTIDNAIEYEQNSVITNYMSQMLNCVYALPLEEQREARQYLLKELNRWDYEPTTAQQQMKTSLVDREIDDKIIIKLPSSTYEWTEDKQKYSYQMTPEEYNSFAKNYLKEVEKYRAWCKKTYTVQDDYVDKLSDYNGAVMKYMRPYYNKAYKSKATRE